MSGDPTVELSLSLREAEALHAALEGLLDNGTENEPLKRAYRLLGWRILAERGGTGLTAMVAGIAREAKTLEEYEARRDEALGPILDGLESPENRDP